LHKIERAQNWNKVYHIFKVSDPRQNDLRQLANVTKVIAFACHKEEMTKWQISFVDSDDGIQKFQVKTSWDAHVTLSKCSRVLETTANGHDASYFVCAVLSTPFYRDIS